MDAVDDVKGAIIDEPPARRPRQAHVVIGEERDAETLGILQQEGAKEAAAERPEQAHLWPHRKAPSGFP